MASSDQTTRTGSTASPPDNSFQATPPSTATLLLREQINAMKKLVSTLVPSPTSDSVQPPSPEVSEQADSSSLTAMLSGVIDGLHSLTLAQQIIISRLDHIEEYLYEQALEAQYVPSPTFQRGDRTMKQSYASGPLSTSSHPVDDQSPVVHEPETGEQQLVTDPSSQTAVSPPAPTVKPLSEDLSNLFASVEAFVQRHLTGTYDPRREELEQAASRFLNKLHSVNSLMDSSYRTPLCCGIINRLLNMEFLRLYLFESYNDPLMESYHTKKLETIQYPRRQPNDTAGLAKLHAELAVLAQIIVKQSGFVAQQFNTQVLILRDAISRTVSSLIPKSQLIPASDELKDIVTQAYDIVIRMIVSPQDHNVTFLPHRKVVDNDDSTIIRNDEKLASGVEKIVRFSIVPLVEEKVFGHNDVSAVVLQKAEVVAMQMPQDRATGRRFGYAGQSGLAGKVAGNA